MVESVGKPHNIIILAITSVQTFQFAIIFPFINRPIKIPMVGRFASAVPRSVLQGGVGGSTGAADGMCALCFIVIQVCWTAHSVCMASSSWQQSTFFILSLCSCWLKKPNKIVNLI
jgi:hypothetical protein